jgi:hypothetical protein
MGGFQNEVVYGTGLDLTNDQPNISNQLGTDGVIYIGNSVGRPQANLPTSSDNSITWTGGNGTLDGIVDTTNIPTVATTYSGDVGSAMPAANILDVLGGTSIETEASLNDVKIDYSGSGALGFVNLGLDYSSNTLTVKGANGSDLSSTNPAYVTVISEANPGQLVTVKVTANQSFVDSGGTSDIVDNLFGLTTGDSWGANDIPFFIYAVINDAEDDIAFMISRTPDKPVSPLAADIGAPDDAVADKQDSFFSLKNIDETLYDSNQALMVGSFRMRFTQPGGADDWTVQAFSNVDGMGKFKEGIVWTYPTGVNGAASSTHLRDNGS